MAYMWFQHSTSGQHDGIACECQFCLGRIKRLHSLIEPYQRRGLGLAEDDVITLVTVKKAFEIAMNRIMEIHQPSRLEALCGEFIHKHIKERPIEELPLPQHIRDNMSFCDYFEEVKTTGNDAYDNEFFSFQAKKLPSVLWKHLGYTVVFSRPHPIDT